MEVSPRWHSGSLLVDALAQSLNGIAPPILPAG
jgi:hypothetical protein